MATDYQTVDEQADSEGIEDDVDGESLAFPTTYDIVTFGADLQVDGLVKRLDEGDIHIPKFQRGYVWDIGRASRFLESLLIGLPTPTVFLWRDETHRLVVIDGQQRLRSIQFFCSGSFKDTGEFALKGVRDDLEGLTYETLGTEQKRVLNDSLLHAIVIRQVAPTGDHSSIYHVFERLNTGMLALKPQEIRACVYQGAFVELLEELNGDEAWRDIFGLQAHARMKDKELILRATALYYARETYQRPMTQFLNEFLQTHEKLKADISGDAMSEAFLGAIHAIHTGIGKVAFRPKGRLNTAVFDAVMVGVATRLAEGPLTDEAGLQAKYKALLEDADFMSMTDRTTTDRSVVLDRIDMGIEAFRDVG